MPPDQPVNFSTHPIINYTLYLADNALVLGQRNSAWCGHGPVLEQDIAITNISLDLIGQARSLYQYAAMLINSSGSTETVTEDTLAYLRDVRDFKNCLLTEQPNGDWGQTILRQFFFSAYQFALYEALLTSTDQTLSAIAEKSLKEVTYHLRWSSEWVIRLGDGTAESHERIAKALNNLWMYTGELFIPADYEVAAAQQGAGIDPSGLQAKWQQKVSAILEEATLSVPATGYMQTGGKNGLHTEHLGYLLAELQFMQRAYPGCEW